MRFQDKCSKVAIELRVVQSGVQFWSKIIPVITIHHVGYILIAIVFSNSMLARLFVIQGLAFQTIFIECHTQPGKL